MSGKLTSERIMVSARPATALSVVSSARRVRSFPRAAAACSTGASGGASGSMASLTAWISGGT